MSLLWYACYGSNMDLGRFLVYINGGSLPNNPKVYPPCIDRTPPVEGGNYIIKNRLYFGKDSKTWVTIDNNGNKIRHGVGFISPKSDSRSITYAKLYLISRVQFSHLFNLENSRVTSITIDYNHLQNNKILDIIQDNNGDNVNYYNRIIKLDPNYNNYPILTFTNQTIQPKNSPKDQYVQYIRGGIVATYGNDLSPEQIDKYFKKAKR